MWGSWLVQSERAVLAPGSFQEPVHPEEQKGQRDPEGRNLSSELQGNLCCCLCFQPGKWSLALGLAAVGRLRKGCFLSSQDCPSSLGGNGRTPWNDLFLITGAHLRCGSAASCSATSKFHFIASHVLSLSLCAPQVATAL